MSERRTTWLREAISDDGGLADMAYIVIGALAVSAISALGFIFAMSTISYVQCSPTTTVAVEKVDKKDDTVHSAKVVPCQFDPLPVGQSAGLIFGAFGALIASLAGYMAATRRSGKAGSTVEQTTVRKETVTTATPAAPAPAPIAAVPEAIAILRPPAELKDRPKRAVKRPKKHPKKRGK